MLSRLTSLPVPVLVRPLSQPLPWLGLLEYTTSPSLVFFKKKKCIFFVFNFLLLDFWLDFRDRFSLCCLICSGRLPTHHPPALKKKQALLHCIF